MYAERYFVSDFAVCYYPWAIGYCRALRGLSICLSVCPSADLSAHWKDQKNK